MTRSPLPFAETTLFPARVAHFSTAYDPDASIVEAEPFGIVLPVALSRAVPRRRFEFAVGRRCAREALQRLAPPLALVDVGIGSQREPLFPAGVVGAISHGAGIASAAVAWQRDYRGVGLDIESWIGDDALAAVEQSVLLPGESPRLATQTGLSARQVATICFSAKETLYKCLFPSVRRYFDFMDAEIESIDLAAGQFTARLRVSLNERWRVKDSCVGRLQLTDSLVITSMVAGGAP